MTVPETQAIATPARPRRPRKKSSSARSMRLVYRGFSEARGRPARRHTRLDEQPDHIDHGDDQDAAGDTKRGARNEPLRCAVPS